MYECQKCAAQHDNNNTGRCLLPGDGGSICGGRLEVPKARTGKLFGEDKLAPSSSKPLLRELLSGATMRAAGRFTDGRAMATLTFASENDRAEFAAVVLTYGGKVTA